MLYLRCAGLHSRWVRSSALDERKSFSFSIQNSSKGNVESSFQFYFPHLITLLIIDNTYTPSPPLKPSLLDTNLFQYFIRFELFIGDGSSKTGYACLWVARPAATTLDPSSKQRIKRINALFIRSSLESRHSSTLINIENKTSYSLRNIKYFSIIIITIKANKILIIFEMKSFRYFLTFHL